MKNNIGSINVNKMQDFCVEKMNDKRPNLNKDIDVLDFKNFYWLKVEFCREIGISGSGGKIEIANRILEYLETGKIIKKTTTKKQNYQNQQSL